MELSAAVGRMLLQIAFIRSSMSMISRDKPIILIFSRYYLPGYRAGGPVQSLSNFITNLSDVYDFRVVCLDRDLGDHAQYSNIITDCWINFEKHRVYYSSPSLAGFGLAKRMLTEIKPDIVYLNSLFDRSFSITPFLACKFTGYTKTLICPRGELSSGALALKPIRKKIFLSAINLMKLYSKSSWHAGSISEQNMIETAICMSSSRIFVANNLSNIVSSGAVRANKTKRGSLRIVLAARISPMKNTAMAIRLAGQLDGDVQLDLWGPIEDPAYWEKCKKQINLIKSNVRVAYRGEISHSKIPEVLQCYDVMLMPTLGENYGHSIIEALGVGLPVIISDRTPWRGLTDAGIGADIPLEQESDYLIQLGRYRDMSNAEMEAVSKTCRAYARQKANIGKNIEAYQVMFDTLLECGIESQHSVKTKS